MLSRYAAVNSWSAVPGLGGEEQEPFIDCSVGGGDLEEGELQVWAVTVGGRVVVRQGVTSSCPEGRGWLHVPTPLGREVAQLSVAPSGLVWAVTWGGGVLVRLGVARMEPSGLSWAEVEAPRPEHPLAMVAVGRGIVWAVSRGGSVWLRQGVRSDGSSEQLAKGTRWVGMVGAAAMLAVGGGDGLVGLGREADRPVLARTGVSVQDLSGKTWRPVSCGQEGDRGLACRSRLSSEGSSSYSSSRGGGSSYGSRAGGGGKLERNEEGRVEWIGGVEEKKDLTSQETPTDGGVGAHAKTLGEKVLKQTEQRMVGLAVGGVARATVGRVPMVSHCFYL